MTEKFRQADLFRAQAEGGYSFTPTDKGGETLFGISRVYNPGWLGWLSVDGVTGGQPIPTRRGRAVNPAQQPMVDAMNSNEELKGDAAEFYYAQFWTPIRGDDIPDEVGMVIYDMAVNSGCSRAIKTLQKCLHGAAVDGHIIQANVDAATDEYLEDSDEFLECLFRKRLEFYRELAQRDPVHGAPNLSGWIARLVNLARYIQLDPLPSCLS